MLHVHRCATKHACDFLNESILHLEIKTDTHYDSPKPRRGVTKTNPCVLTGPRPVQCCELSQHQAATRATPAHVDSGEIIVWGDNSATHPLWQQWAERIEKIWRLSAFSGDHWIIWKLQCMTFETPLYRFHNLFAIMFNKKHYLKAIS